MFKPLVYNSTCFSMAIIKFIYKLVEDELPTSVTKANFLSKSVVEKVVLSQGSSVALSRASLPKTNQSKHVPGKISSNFNLHITNIFISFLVWLFPKHHNQIWQLYKIYTVHAPMHIADWLRGKVNNTQRGSEWAKICAEWNRTAILCVDIYFLYMNLIFLEWYSFILGKINLVIHCTSNSIHKHVICRLQ